MSGRTIRGARGVMKWSTKRLAEEAGVGVATLNRFENENDVYKKTTVDVENRIMKAVKSGLADVGWELAPDGSLLVLPEELTE